MLSFDNPWWVVLMVGIAISARLAGTRIGALARWRSSVLEFVDSALIALLLVFCILRPFVIQAFYIPSGSMLETLQINDRILVNKFVYFFREPEPGDIIVFRAPEEASEDKKDFIKRVVGLPGDQLAVHDGKLWRNGQAVDEPYIREPIRYIWPDEWDLSAAYVVPPDSLMVFGDNRNDSNDGHQWGPLPRENVLGKAMVIFWPPQRIRLLHR
jgi:signal peptidase I